MKLRTLPVALVVGLLAALLVLATGVAAQDDTGNLALTATALAGGAPSGPGVRATLTPLPSLTPGGAAVQTSTPVPANATSTPLPSVTPGQRASVTPLPSLTAVGEQPAAASVTPEPAVPTEAPTSTPLPSLTPEVAGVAGEEAGTPSGEVQLEVTAQEAAATAIGEGLAPVSLEVPYVTVEQEPPGAPASAAGMGTLILLFGLGGATVIGLLMLARDRYRDHSSDE